MKKIEKKCYHFSLTSWRVYDEIGQKAGIIETKKGQMQIP